MIKVVSDKPNQVAEMSMEAVPLGEIVHINGKAYKAVDNNKVVVVTYEEV